MNRLLPMIAVSAALALSVPASSQVVGPDDPCTAGAKWHLQQAMRWTEREDQNYHIGAADSMVRLAAMQDDCSGWDQDAHRPDRNGDMSAQAADNVQSQQVMGL